VEDRVAALEQSRRPSRADRRSVSGWGPLRLQGSFRASLRSLVSGLRPSAADEETAMYEETANPAGRKSDRKASSVLGSLGEASRTLGEGFRAALGISSERRGSGGGGGGGGEGGGESRRGSPKGSRHDGPGSAQGGVAAEEGAAETLEVTVLARTTQAMPMDASLRRTLREIRQIAAERREVEGDVGRSREIYGDPPDRGGPNPVPDPTPDPDPNPSEVEALRQRGSLGALGLGLDLLNLGQVRTLTLTLTLQP